MSLVCECLKYSPILEEVLDLCNLQSSDRRLKKSRELTLVVLHRHLFGKGLNGCFAKFKVSLCDFFSALIPTVVLVFC